MWGKGMYVDELGNSSATVDSVTQVQGEYFT